MKEDSYISLLQELVNEIFVILGTEFLKPYGQVFISFECWSEVFDRFLRTFTWKMTFSLAFWPPRYRKNYKLCFYKPAHLSIGFIKTWAWNLFERLSMELARIWKYYEILIICLSIPSQVKEYWNGKWRLKPLEATDGQIFVWLLRKWSSWLSSFWSSASYIFRIIRPADVDSFW